MSLLLLLSWLSWFLSCLILHICIWCLGSGCKNVCQSILDSITLAHCISSISGLLSSTMCAPYHCSFGWQVSVIPTGHWQSAGHMMPETEAHWRQISLLPLMDTNELTVPFWVELVSYEPFSHSTIQTTSFKLINKQALSIWWNDCLKFRNSVTLFEMRKQRGSR